MPLAGLSKKLYRLRSCNRFDLKENVDYSAFLTYIGPLKIELNFHLHISRQNWSSKFKM